MAVICVDVKAHGNTFVHRVFTVVPFCYSFENLHSLQKKQKSVNFHAPTTSPQLRDLTVWRDVASGRQKDGEHFWKPVKKSDREEGDEDPDGGTGRRRENHHPLQAEAGRDRHHHPHHRYDYFHLFHFILCLFHRDIVL